MGFNSAFKGLRLVGQLTIYADKAHVIKWSRFEKNPSVLQASSTIVAMFHFLLTEASDLIILRREWLLVFLFASRSCFLFVFNLLLSI